MFKVAEFADVNTNPTLTGLEDKCRNAQRQSSNHHVAFCTFPLQTVYTVHCFECLLIPSDTDPAKSERLSQYFHRNSLGSRKQYGCFPNKDEVCESLSRV